MYASQHMKIIDEIADLIDFYNGKKRNADYGFVDGICSLYVNEKGLNQYLKNIFIDGVTIKKRGSNYNAVFRTLSVDLNERPTPSYKLLLGDQYVSFNNVKKAWMTLHELEHVDQERLFDEPETTFEHKLVKLNNFMYMYPPYFDSDDLTLLDRLIGKIISKRADRYYYKHHDSAPIERLANIKSLELTKEIMDSIGEDRLDRAYIELTDYGSKQMRNIMESGYVLKGTKTNSPSFDYLKGLKEIREFVTEEEFEEEREKSSLREKVLYGLPLTEEEYHSLDTINPFAKKYKR